MSILSLDDPRWRSFVGLSPDATPFHHPDWTRLVADCYGFRSFVVAAQDDAGAIRAGLPVVEVRHVMGGPRWVALPFTDYLAPLGGSREDEAALEAALRADALEAGVRRIEIRSPWRGGPSTSLGAWRHVLALESDPAAVYARLHRSQVQRSIRRAERNGLTVRVGDRRDDLLRTFYDLHLRTRRRQGVPIQPRRFFRLMWERVIRGGLGSVLIAETGDRPVAAGVFLFWNKSAIYKFGASDKEAWRLRPNHLVMWTAIRTACEQGCESFDFGRTDAVDEGLRAFKLSWGTREEPLEYRVIGAGGGVRASGPARRALGFTIRRGPALVCRASGELLYRFAA